VCIQPLPGLGRFKCGILPHSSPPKGPQLSLCPELLEQSPERGHLVQLYEADEQPLIGNVSVYLAESLEGGGGAIIVATPEHRDAFLTGLAAQGIDIEAAGEAGRLTLLDAEGTLAKFLIDDYPDAERFAHTIGTALRHAIASSNSGKLNVYGEMVGILWKARQYPAAIRLEQLWNKLRKSHDFNLFCAYPIDIFDKQFRTLGALLCAHTHLLPFGQTVQLDRAVNRAIDELLGSRGDEVRASLGAKPHPSLPAMPSGEALILWLHDNLPDNAEAILSRAREYYQFSA